MLDLLQKIDKLECKPVNVSIEQNHMMRFEEESAKVDKGRFQSLVRVDLLGTY